MEGDKFTLTAQLNAATIQRFEKLLYSDGFPRCAIRLMSKLKDYVQDQASTVQQFVKIQQFKNNQTIESLIEKFIFQPCCKKKFVNVNHWFETTAMQQLQLFEILLTQFNDIQSSHISYCILDALFGISSSCNEVEEVKMSVLSRMVSMCIALNCVPVLNGAALWLEKCNTSDRQASLNIAEMLLADYCLLVPDLQQTLLDLCNCSPTFVAQLITAFTLLFDIKPGNSGSLDNNNYPRLPPISLMRIVAEWTVSNPHSFTVAKTTENLPHFYSSKTENDKMDCSEIHSTIYGLARWSTLVPLLYICRNEPANVKTIEEVHISCSKLQCGILQALSECSNHKEAEIPNKNSPPTLTISLNMMQEIAVDLQKCIQQVTTSSSSQNPDTDKLVEWSLNRLTQFVQVAFSANQLKFSLEEINNTMEALPKTRLWGTFIRLAKS
ncbi:Uncharacterized protein C7orf26-like protein [Trichoplax sp. H2]|nr:Uncharacterized protein C7orf26-like protein [Trichoplax sp. H2]|eukprot:RDD43997.1 Uncharacterized protein C7orf26-like protein [Trichoplax sp. H2]